MTTPPKDWKPSSKWFLLTETAWMLRIPYWDERCGEEVNICFDARNVKSVNKAKYHAERMVAEAVSIVRQYLEDNGYDERKTQ